MKTDNYLLKFNSVLYLIILILIFQGCSSMQLSPDLLGENVEMTVIPSDNGNILTNKEFIIRGKILKYDDEKVELKHDFFMKDAKGNSINTSIIPIEWIANITVIPPPSATNNTTGKKESSVSPDN
jgi:hypothetical protein